MPIILGGAFNIGGTENPNINRQCEEHCFVLELVCTEDKYSINVLAANTDGATALWANNLKGWYFFGHYQCCRVLKCVQAMGEPRRN